MAGEVISRKKSKDKNGESTEPNDVEPPPQITGQKIGGAKDIISDDLEAQEGRQVDEEPAQQPPDPNQ